MQEILLNRRNMLKFTVTAGTAIMTGSGAVLLDGCDTSWIDTAKKDLPTIMQVVGTITPIVTAALGYGYLIPVEGVVIQQAASGALVSLNTLQDLINAYDRTKDASTVAKVDAILDTILKDMSSILSAVAHVKNPDLLNTINGIVGVASSVVSSIQLLVPPAPNASTRRLAAPQHLATKVTLINSDQIKTLTNSILVTNGYSQQQIR